jgi:hypothetical protein
MRLWPAREQRFRPVRSSTIVSTRFGLVPSPAEPFETEARLQIAAEVRKVALNRTSGGLGMWILAGCHDSPVVTSRHRRPIRSARLGTPPPDSRGVTIELAT